MADPRYKRVLLKISGEALMGAQDYGMEPAMVSRIAGEVKSVHALGGEVCLVIGGGNIFRGVSGTAKGMERATADYMGMLATVINSLGMQSALESLDVPTRVLSALPISAVCEPYIRRRAIRHLEQGRVVIFAAGTGNPYFTTDTAASLRAMEINAQAIFKATKVDGVYDKDPMKHGDARRYRQISYLDALNMGLKVMDATAISLCMDNTLPIVVFAMEQPGNLKQVLMGHEIGTRVAKVATELA